jgi:hypothetical protein
MWVALPVGLLGCCEPRRGEWRHHAQGADYNAELKALEDKARGLKARRVEQLGQLVTATGADALDMKRSPARCSMPSRSQNAEAKEAWRAKGAAFFQRRGRKGGRTAGGNGDAQARNRALIQRLEAAASD